MDPGWSPWWAGEEPYSCCSWAVRPFLHLLLHLHHPRPEVHHVSWLSRPSAKASCCPSVVWGSRCSLSPQAAPSCLLVPHGSLGLASLWGFQPPSFSQGVTYLSPLLSDPPNYWVFFCALNFRVWGHGGPHRSPQDLSRTTPRDACQHLNRFLAFRGLLLFRPGKY